MLNRKTLLAMSITLISTTALAGQWYKSANEHAIYCATPDLAVEVLNVDAERLNRLEGSDGLGVSCAELSANQAFEVTHEDPSGDAPKQIYVPDSHVRGATYIAGPIVPAADPTRAAACKPTDIGPTGEVDGWILEADGTPKLKRFMITSKCVNGRMMSHTKRLN